MASNGDEAVDMVSGKQKHELISHLRWHEKTKKRKPIDLLLFSGGGNDIVGSNDFERFIRPFKSGFSPRDCLRIRRLSRKIKQIGLAYQELLDIRDHYSPSTLVMTHTYDYPFASLKGANFLGGLISTKGWMKRFMDEIAIPDVLQTGVIRELMDMMAAESLKIAAARPGFIVADTRGTLLNKHDWENEIHPDEKGFRAIADKMYVEIEQHFPSLARS
jgi:lysophospholipase L1-like esterase